MQHINTINPEATNGETRLVAMDKNDFSALFSVSKRTLDSWLAIGLPHLKLSARQVRIPVLEATQWVHERFLQRRVTISK